MFLFNIENIGLFLIVVIIFVFMIVLLCVIFVLILEIYLLSLLKKLFLCIIIGYILCVVKFIYFCNDLIVFLLLLCIKLICVCVKYEESIIVGDNVLSLNIFEIVRICFFIFFICNLFVFCKIFIRFWINDIRF